LVEKVLTHAQRAILVDWLARRASGSAALGRVYFAQLGANISEQARFVELMHTASQEFIAKKAQALSDGKRIF
jgi:hypothetical protein